MASCSRLCDLLTRSSLLHYIEPKPIAPLTKENEKNILPSLSKVSRQIKQWIDSSNCEPKREAMENLDPCLGCSQHLDRSLEGSRNCLANVVSGLVAFLSFDTQFVQHSAGNLLAVISDYLNKHEAIWVEFILMLWVSAEVAMARICSCSSTIEFPSIVFSDGSGSLCQAYTFTNHEGSNFLKLSKSRWESVTWSMVAAIFRILRNILKCLQRDNDALEDVYMQHAFSSLLNMPWHLMGESHTTEKSYRRGNFGGRESDLTSSKVLLGAVLQILCSLVQPNDSEHVPHHALEKLPVYTKFTNLVSKVFALCFSSHLACLDKQLSQYLQHKLLVLMIRLSFLRHWQSSSSLLWLQLLEQYFGDILNKPILDYDGDIGTSLEESPFFTSIADEDKAHTSGTRHLQRQVIFLFFKCCFTLVNTPNGVGQKCACGNTDFSCACGLQLCVQNKCSLVLSKFSKWIQRCVFPTKFVGCENKSKSCSNSALSFLQLYIEEDDMLFKMLLQLLDAPFVTIDRQFDTKKMQFEEENEGMLVHISTIYNPFHLFHLFLQLLHYDHLVLLDYLISKDTGIHCLQYLLRCLRLICKSWHIFVEFLPCEGEGNQLGYKRRKICLDEDVSKEQSSSATPIELKRQHARKDKVAITHKSSERKHFENAKLCLLSLKKSVEDLHQKELFPYNPEPLIRSLTRFLVLC